jgi:hypothetical protein
MERPSGAQAGLRASTQHRDHQLAPVGPPRAGRLEKLQAVEMRVGCRTEQLAPDLAGLGVGDKQVDRQAIAFREKRNEGAVRAQPRPHIDPSAVLMVLAEQQRGPAGQRRQVALHHRDGLPNRAVPCLGQGVGIAAELQRESLHVKPRVGSRTQQ